MFPDNHFSRIVDAGLLLLGRLSAWLWLGVLAVVVANVVARFFLRGGSIWLVELSWHLFGAAMLLSLSYAVVTDSHVRVDLFHERFQLKTKAAIELVGFVLLLLPALYILIAELIPYAHRSFIYNERSQAPSGLPYRWILKSLVPIAFALLALAVVSRLSKCTTTLFNIPRQLPPREPPPTP
ncbi:C4-dicarboxylate ABC transporter permease [Alkalilimnicola ehrlichii]|uniref:TRAP transporter small permease subunit n=1 Tax=Alkalilimnicola ehrlichii TaxID=351052 RepID=UPI000E2F1626|nr:TRAP transporter small permease subunit [Alkalilimnicola ehrlichii]RFA24750.1 C4-dicarboxylate ABC transporter permease [Alkalilimnicola ehrlichii]